MLEEKVMSPAKKRKTVGSASKMAKQNKEKKPLPVTILSGFLVSILFRESHFEVLIMAGER